MSNENLLRLVMLFDASEEAEVMINALRNAGLIVRDIRAEDEEDLQNAVEENPVDLVLAQQKLTDYSARQAAEFLALTGRDIPLIAITPPGKETTALDVLQVGGRDIVASDQVEKFKHIVKRELSDLKERRALRRTETLLRETEKRARILIDNSRDAIAYVHDGMHIYANSAYLKMFGYETMEDLEGVPIMDMVSAEEHPKLKEFLRSYTKGQSDSSDLEVQGQHVEGKKFKITMEFSPASMEGESCTQIIIRDQSLSKELEKKLNVLSQQDLLTGLYNRNFFIEQLDKFIGRAVEGSERGALLYITLDQFAAIKEDLGLSASDILLTDIAQLLKSKLSDLGTLARFEGPVFTLLLRKVDAKDAGKISSAICKLVHEYIADVNGKSTPVTVSIGIALINETATNREEVIMRAEKGAQQAHKDGGNRHHLYSPVVEELAEQEQLNHWTQRIKHALKNNLFRLLFQPIVSLHGEPGAYYEVLVRMLDENEEEIPPGEFITAAEQMGLMNFVDRWVIANALMILAKRHKDGEDTHFFIKLSQGSLTDPEFLPWVSERIKSLRIDTESMVFQISEQAALNYLKPAKMIVDGLKELHCRTALEGFGLEQNTYQSLKHLDVEYVKIHMNLVQGLAQSVENQEKIKAIAEEVSGDGRQTIAAFVEDANSLAVLWQCSVDFIQGHFLQQPEVDLSYDFEEGF
ncbi:MAG: EAL domain-containing protein [Gammaproteobacteria bacterium]